jgi:hypothetical protein
MPLIIKPTVLQSASLAGAEAAHHLAGVLRAGWEKYWQRSPETILAEMESDLANTLAIFQLNTQAGTAVNALLDALADDRFTARAPVALPDGWAFYGTSFTFTPPAQPTEPEL